MTNKITSFEGLECLELCCGSGSFSDYMKKKGAKCTGIDIKNIGYKHRFIKADILDWKPDRHYDIIQASPPCSNFSQVNMNWNGKNNAMKGLDLVYRVFYLINEIKPAYYIIENVEGLARFLPPPNDIIKLGTRPNAKKMAFWHNLGHLGLIEHFERKTSRTSFKSGCDEVGRIPEPILTAFASKFKIRK